MQYLKDHQEYLGLGGVCDATAYARFSDRAFGIVDNATHNRIECMAKVPQRAKALCRDLVEYLANDFGSSKQISNHSQSAGGVSESESYATKTAEDYSADLDRIFEPLSIVKTKNGVSITYRGAMS